MTSMALTRVVVQVSIQDDGPYLPDLMLAFINLMTLLIALGQIVISVNEMVTDIVRAIGFNIKMMEIIISSLKWGLT